MLRTSVAFILNLYYMVYTFLLIIISRCVYSFCIIRFFDVTTREYTWSGETKIRIEKNPCKHAAKRDQKRQPINLVGPAHVGQPQLAARFHDQDHQTAAVRVKRVDQTASQATDPRAGISRPTPSTPLPKKQPPSPRTLEKKLARQGKATTLTRALKHYSAAGKNLARDTTTLPRVSWRCSKLVAFY